MNLHIATCAKAGIISTAARVSPSLGARRRRTVTIYVSVLNVDTLAFGRQAKNRLSSPLGQICDEDLPVYCVVSFERAAHAAWKYKCAHKWQSPREGSKQTGYSELY
jgi:hypothetical protein